MPSGRFGSPNNDGTSVQPVHIGGSWFHPEWHTNCLQRKEDNNKNMEMASFNLRVGFFQYTIILYGFLWECLRAEYVVRIHEYWCQEWVCAHSISTNIDFCYDFIFFYRCGMSFLEVLFFFFSFQFYQRWEMLILLTAPFHTSVPLLNYMRVSKANK